MKKYFGCIDIESIFSDDDKHRFVLRRRFSTSRNDLKDSKLVYILINPSYADELLLDKTNRLASNIGLRDGFIEVVILNLFSLITKNTEELKHKIAYANDKQNDDFIIRELGNADRVIISWGTDSVFQERIEEVIQLIKHSGVTRNKVFGIRFQDKNKKIYDPAHLSMYITDNPSNYELKHFEF